MSTNLKRLDLLYQINSTYDRILIKSIQINIFLQQCFIFIPSLHMKYEVKENLTKRETLGEREWARISDPTRESQRVTFREDPRWAYPGNTDGNKKSAFSN